MCSKLRANDNNQAINHIPNLIIRNLDIFEVKQLTDKENEYKKSCKQAIRDYKKWRQSHSDETDTIELLYSALEGEMHLSRVQNTVKIYWIVRRHARLAFVSYIHKTQKNQKLCAIAA